jgi:hypothetical protein
MSNKKLTPEEIIRRKSFEVDQVESAVYITDAINAMKQYAAQEIADKDAEIGRLKADYSEYTVRSINDQAKLKHVILEKDALLKEAIDKGEKLYSALMSIHLQFGDESHAFEMSNELYNWCDFMHSNGFKAAGKEAAEDE